MSDWSVSAWAGLLSGIAWKGSAIIILAWVITAVMRGRSAAARHLVWTAAFSMLLCLPFLSLSLPEVRLPFDESVLPPGLTFAANAVAGREGKPDSLPAAEPAAPASETPAGPYQRLDWRVLLISLWGVGAVLGLARMGMALRTLDSVRRKAATCSDAAARPLASRFGVGNEVEFLETSSGMPMAFGLIRPAVFLPAEARQWSEERRRVVLLHELAHIRRGDPATHLLARVALCLHWWNPLAWIGWRSFLNERERAADDLVLGAGERASHYAEHLLEIARSLQVSPNLRWAAVAMARQSQLEGRVMAILDSGKMRNGFGRAASAAAMIAALILSAPLASVRGQNASSQVSPDVDTTIRAAAAQKNHEILEGAARRAEEIRNFDAARKLLDSSLEMRADVSGQKSVAYGLGLLKLADLERRRNNSLDALQFYQKAANVLGDSSEAAPAVTYLGIDAALRKDYTRALELLQRAQLLDPSKAATAMMWTAVVKKQQGKLDEAEGMYQAALVAENGETTDRAVILDLYGLLLRAQNREQEALTMEGRARDIRKNLMPKAPVVVGAVRVGGGVTAPKLLSKVEPKYTDEARLAKFQGTVVISVIVGADGEAHSLRVLRGLGLGLDERALDAITQWRFQPGMREGQPVAVQATIEVNFRLL